MKTRIIYSTLLVVLLAIAAVGVAGAQDRPRDDRPGWAGAEVLREALNIVVEETGLNAREIVVQLQDGSTLADIITVNGGDVQSVIDQVVALATERIDEAVSTGRITQERADQMLANLADVVTRGINGELFPNRLDRGSVRRASERILVQAVADATGLRPAEILRQMAEGSTMADIITANAGDVQAVVDAAVAAATEQINAAVADERITQVQADELIASLETVYTDAVNGEYRQRAAQLRVGLGVVRLAAEQTGLDVREITAQLRDGKSLATVLTENGVDVSAFIEDAVTAASERLSQAVANGRITQERADELLAEFRENLTERMNQSFAAA